jgi:hypothetical protein
MTPPRPRPPWVADLDERWLPPAEAAARRRRGRELADAVLAGDFRA